MGKHTYMTSPGFILEKETFKYSIEEAAKNILKDFKLALKDPQELDPADIIILTSDYITTQLFNSVLKRMAFSIDDECPPVKPEETMVELIRSGVPADSVSAGYRYLTANLPNAKYRVYRSTSGYAPGTLRIVHGNIEATTRTCYSPKETAEFILLIDPLLPEVFKAGDALFLDISRLIKQRQAEQKAMEIAKKAVDMQLAAVLPGMNIACTYRVKGDKVSLKLTRELKASIDIPLEELAGLLSDPERIESALMPVPVKDVDEEHDFRMRRSFGTMRPYYPSNIIFTE